MRTETLDILADAGINQEEADAVKDIFYGITTGERKDELRRALQLIQAAHMVLIELRADLIKKGVPEDDFRALTVALIPGLIQAENELEIKEGTKPTREEWIADGIFIPTAADARRNMRIEAAERREAAKAAAADVM